jgi:hypothetical protein
MGAASALALLGAGGVLFAATAGEALFINARGYVGLGTTDPVEKLHVSAGSIQVDGTQQIKFTNTGSTNALKVQLWEGFGLGINAGTLFYAADGRHSWRDSSGTTERMALTTAADGGLTVTGTGISSFGGTVRAQAFEAAGTVIVNGMLTATVRHQQDDEAETTYVKPLQRYHVSLSAAKYAGRTRTIPREILRDLCGTRDGCQVRIGMTRWGNDTLTETASRSFQFYYSHSDGRWRTSDDRAGVIGNKAREDAINIWDTCYFMDASFANFKDQGDQNTGMQLLLWNGYKGPNRTCELTLIP